MTRLAAVFPSQPSDRAAYAAHLLRLDLPGRMRRFGGGISENGVRALAQGWRAAHAVALIDVDGVWRGVVEIHRTDAHEAELALSVEPSWRGKGWGMALLDAAEGWGRANGFTSFTLTLATHNPSMRHLAGRKGASTQSRWDGGGEVMVWSMEAPA